MVTKRAAPDFPVPPDVEGFWQWDKMHSPRPVTPLTQDIIWSSATEGFTTAMDELGCPFGVSYRMFNSYSYMGLVPFENDMAGGIPRRERYGRTLREFLPSLGELWERDWLPSITPAIDRAMRFDYTQPSDEELKATLDRMLNELKLRYLIHGRINFVTICASWFADFYNDAFHPEDPTEPYAVLQGFSTRSLDAGRGLWRLSRGIVGDSGLRSTVEQGSAEDLVSELQASKRGQEWLTEFRSYLDEFGWRSDAFELAEKTWREDPRIPLNALQGYVLLGGEADPDVRFQEAVTVREHLLEQARRKLAGDGIMLRRFNQLYDMARYYLPITEDHNFYIDQRGNAVMRLALMEAGRRLASRGNLEVADDVFFLHYRELHEAINGADCGSLAEEHRQEIDRWSRVLPAPVIGTPPASEGEPTDPLIAALVKMFGIPIEPDRDPRVIKGIAASQGKAHGRARVVRQLSEASKLRKGDVLVCEMTMPAWTPLFSTVSALVADTGGVLSHCAIVSREYRLPAVVGTQIGTSVIKDGMLLTVDGTKGIVRIGGQ